IVAQGRTEGVGARAVAGQPRVEQVAQAVLLIAGFGMGWALERASWWSYPATWRGVVDLGVGWAFLLTGFLATWRRPANRTGRLLSATGLSWYAGNLRFLGDAAGSPDLGARADDRRCARLRSSSSTSPALRRPP